MFKAHASVQDLQALLEKRYIYQFENGVIVIKHWRMANALRKDRYTPTAFQEELAHLKLKDNGSYSWLPDGCQPVAGMAAIQGDITHNAKLLTWPDGTHTLRVCSRPVYREDGWEERGGKKRQPPQPSPEELYETAEREGKWLD
jgi:hypothetical protein